MPLYNLNDTVKLIKERYTTLTFSKHFSFHTKVKSQLTFREGIKGFKFDEYNAVCQFFNFRREDAIKFVETFDHWSQYFVKNKVIFADEFYFWGIAKELGMNFNMGQATTYSDWSIRKMPDGRMDRNPKVFNNFNSYLLQKIRSEGFLYVRKVTPQTLVTTKLF